MRRRTSSIGTVGAVSLAPVAIGYCTTGRQPGACTVTRCGWPKTVGTNAALSYLGFWLATVIGHGNGAAAGIAAVSVLYTAGEIMYTGSATALIAATTPSHLLGRALARFQLTSGIGLAASPAVLMVLLGRGEGAMWGTLILATGLAALAVARLPAEHSTDEPR
jgi:hypothetical protein